MVISRNTGIFIIPVHRLLLISINYNTHNMCILKSLRNLFYVILHVIAMSSHQSVTV